LSHGQEIIKHGIGCKGLQSAFGSISDGRAAGMTIQDIRSIGKFAGVIDAIMQEGGEPNLAAWQTVAGRSMDISLMKR